MYSLFNLLFSGVFGYPWGLLLLGGADLLALASVPSVLLRRRGRPLAAMSWLFALFVLPYLGIIGWWLIGRERIRRRRRLRRESTEEFRESLEEVEHDQPSRDEREAFDDLLPPGLFERYGPLEVMGPSRGNQAELLVDGDEMFPAIERTIESADNYVHLLFYIWQDDETGRRIRDLLVEKAREGVEVRVLVDAFGSPKMAGKLGAPLVEAGGEVDSFLPPTFLAWRPTFNFRNHRKLVVADGREAVTGGMNIGNEYEHEWHDMGVHLRGPVVQDIHTVFLDDWLFATRENLAADRYLRGAEIGAAGGGAKSDRASACCAVFASGPDSDQPSLQDGMMHAIHGARERLWMMTPYFIPSGEMLSALRSAVQRGVDVRLMLPEHGDVHIVRRASRAYYDNLLQSGVRLFEYQPRILHAKASVVDDRYVMLGSANLDVRSFEIDFELTTFIASEPLNSDLAEVFRADFEQSREIDLGDVKSQWWVSALADSVAHLTSPQL
jgi:cardiolipin synthase